MLLAAVLLAAVLLTAAAPPVPTVETVVTAVLDDAGAPPVPAVALEAATSVVAVAVAVVVVVKKGFPPVPAVAGLPPVPLVELLLLDDATALAKGPVAVVTASLVLLATPTVVVVAATVEAAVVVELAVEALLDFPPEPVLESRTGSAPVAQCVSNASAAADERTTVRRDLSCSRLSIETPWRWPVSSEHKKADTQSIHDRRRKGRPPSP